MSQVRKACGALLKHIKAEAQRKEEASKTKNLLANSNDPEDTSAADAEPLWLILTTKKHIVDKARLKPGKILVPHPLYDPNTSTICLITADPQRAFKDTIALESFPKTVSSRITRVLGISKLKARYKAFESRRQLLNEHDLFLADDRIVTLLPQLLGKTFYGGSKRPMPVNVKPYRQKDSTGKRKKVEKEAVAPPSLLAKEVGNAFRCAQVHLSPGATTSIRVGLSSFTVEQVTANVDAVINGMVAKFVAKGWRNVKSIHIKGPTTMAIPLWLSDELWVDAEDVLEDQEAKRLVELADQKTHKRKRVEGEEDGISKKKRVTGVEDSDMSAEMAERRERLRQQKREAREAVST
ncbi:hypothetical protein MMC09_003552 [Bachmanniomyces sp. S44760]|nr:hypothetical protein [Bachmanniomyces sp. S44760]